MTSIEPATDTTPLTFAQVTRLGLDLEGRRVYNPGNDLTATVDNVALLLAPGESGFYMLSVTIEPGQDARLHYAVDKLSIVVEDDEDSGWHLVDQPYTDDEGELTPAGETYVGNMKARRVERELSEAKQAVESLRNQRRTVREDLIQARAAAGSPGWTVTGLLHVIDKAVRDLGGDTHADAGYDAYMQETQEGEQKPASDSGTYH